MDFTFLRQATNNNAQHWGCQTAASKVNGSWSSEAFLGGLNLPGTTVESELPAVGPVVGPVLNSAPSDLLGLLTGLAWYLTYGKLTASPWTLSHLHLP